MRKPCVFIKIGYTQGLNGSNILVLKEKDAKNYKPTFDGWEMERI